MPGKTEIQIDSLIRGARRTIAVRITDEGKLEVRAPAFVPLFVIRKFVADRSDWIDRTRQAIAGRTKDRPVFAEGALFPVFGEPYSLHLTDGNVVTTLGRQIFFPRRLLPDARTTMREWYTKQARKAITGRMEFFAARMNVSYRMISIRDVHTRWGSCSTSGTVSFSWRLAMAPPDIVDYVVVHELSHTVHHDHSHAFWDTVFRYYPAYRTARTWLRRNGHTLEF
jgi:predicted metal-dependent hydrolase